MHNDPTPADFTFLIQNTGDRATVIAGPVQCQPTLVTIQSASDEVPGTWNGPPCAATCEDAMKGACGCTADCPATEAIRIEPGGQYKILWHGMVMVPAELPAECINDDCGTACHVSREVPEGVVHEVTVGIVDPEMCLDAACDCVANVDGWCKLDGYYDSAEPATFGFTYESGQATVVALE